jgi:hypothetical protein
MLRSTKSGHTRIYLHVLLWFVLIYDTWWISDTCGIIKLYYAVFTKGFNLILEYNHVTILSKYLLSLTRGLLKKKSSCLWTFARFARGSSDSASDCKKWNVTDASFYMIWNGTAKTCKNIQCNGEMSWVEWTKC